jgi:hypothetical protein
MDMTSVSASASVSVRVIVATAALLVPLGAHAQAKEEPVHAAAKLTGITSGMAMACGIDSKPVLHAYRDFLDRKRIFGSKRERLVKVVSVASDRGFATQREPGAMSCADARTQMQRAVRRLQRAK